MRGTSGEKRSTCDSQRGRTFATLLRIGAAAGSRAAGMEIGGDLTEGETLEVTTSWLGRPSGSRSHRPLPSDRGWGAQPRPADAMRWRKPSTSASKMPKLMYCNCLGAPLA